MSRIAPDRNIKENQLLHSIIENLDRDRTRFAFLLGAGASRSSGIGSAAELARKWMNELKKYYPEAIQKLDIDSTTDRNKMAEAYSNIYQARFGHNPADGYHELEAIITNTNVDPSLGYVLLANLMLKTANNLVLTVNFDRLVETALLTVFNRHAKVVYHESMLPIVSLSDSKPTVVKIHNDVFFQPKSKDKEIGVLSTTWKAKIREILSAYHLIVLGYGGNDKEGLMKYLTKTADPSKVYWCYRQEHNIPSEIIKHKYYCVKVGGFDEFMFALNEKLPKSKSSNLETIKEQIRQAADAKINMLDDRMDYIMHQNEGTESKSTMADIQNFVANTSNTWWEVQRRVQEATDNDIKDNLYKEGLQKFPKSAELMCNYAIFLKNISGDNDQAEYYYKKALELKPDNAINNSNYANFLKSIREEYDQAEHYYEEALRLDPNLATAHGNYANLLTNTHARHGQAEYHYKSALSIEPDAADFNGNYARFLFARGYKKEALTFLDKAEKLSNNPELDLELAFYRLAHFPDSYADSKARILELLAEGIRSVGWDFSANIARAEQDGCEYVDELRELAARITTAE